MTGRDKNGRFTAGNDASKKENGGNGGRPPRKREERYLEIALNTCTFRDWKAIIGKAVEQAIKGDTAARKWLSDYLIGPPAQKHEISGATGGPLQLEYINNWRDAQQED